LTRALNHLHSGIRAEALDEPFVARMRQFAQVCVWLIVATAVLVLIGWLFDIAAFKAVYGSISMKTNAAVTLLLAGIALHLSLPDPNRGRAYSALASAASLGVMLMGAATFTEHLFGWDLGIDQLLASEQPGAEGTMSPNRMGPHVSLSFTLCGLALFLLNAERIVQAQLLALVSVAFAFTAIVGYAYGVHALYGVARYTSIALQAAIALFLLGLGVIAARPTSGLIAVLSTRSAGSVLARRLLLAGVLVPVVLGWLRVLGQELGYYGTAFGTSVLVVAIVLTFTFVVLHTAAVLNRSEQAAEEVEERFKLMADQAPVLVWVAQSDGNRVWFNRPWQEFSGVDVGYDIGYGWADRIHPSDVRKTLDRYRLAVRDGEAFELEYRLRRHDGEYRWLLDKGVPRTLPDGRFAGHVGSCIDITDRRYAEAELERLYASETRARMEAERATRLRDEFLATVSHELRTPLNAILGWAHLLGSGQLEGPAATRAVETIVRNARTQAQLIEDLLDVSRIIAGRLRLDIRSVSLIEVIRAAAEAVRPAAAAKAIELHLELDSSADQTQGDSVRLQQIVWNLLSNAIKFTPQSGRVSVTLARVESSARIVVSDTGEGISEAFLPYVFDRFQQADAAYTRRHGGLGLGLAISRHLVEMHGGTIEASSAGEGRGATFTVSLPLLNVERAASTTTAIPSLEGAPVEAKERSPLSGLRILVLDDQSDTLLMMQPMLESFGAQVACASCVTDAVPLVRTWKPTVILSDIGMPEEDGYAFLQKLRALPADQGGATPAIALTGYVRVEERERALAAGFQMFVPKPVIAGELVDAITTVLAQQD